MADLRIVDAPEIPTENITGEEKLPTGGSGNYSISLDSLADYTKTKKDLADNTSVDGKVNGVRQELDAHIEDLLNPHQVTKGQIGLGNVDNTADADKPVSNSTQAAIISAVAPKADKTYVDNQLTLKANKSETYTKQESSDLVNNSISTSLTPINTALDLAKRGIANRYDSSLTYNSGERAVLTNGDIVKSTIDGNTNDPNVDMTGWVKTNSAGQIFDASGKDQQEINDSIGIKWRSKPSGYNLGDRVLLDTGYVVSSTRNSNTENPNTSMNFWRFTQSPIFPEMFGSVLGVGNSDALSKCLVYAKNYGVPVQLGMTNNYDVYGQLNIQQGVVVRGVGSVPELQRTTLVLKTADSKVIVNSGAIFSDVLVSGTSVALVGVEVLGARPVLTNVGVMRCRIGLLLNKTQNGTFINCTPRFNFIGVQLFNGARNNSFFMCSGELGNSYTPTFGTALQACMINLHIDKAVSSVTHGGNANNRFFGGIFERCETVLRVTSTDGSSPISFGTHAQNNSFYNVEFQGNKCAIDTSEITVARGIGSFNLYDCQLLGDTSGSSITKGTVGYLYMKNTSTNGYSDSPAKGISLASNIVNDDAFGFSTTSGNYSHTSTGASGYYTIDSDVITLKANSNDTTGVILTSYFQRQATITVPKNGFIATVSLLVENLQDGDTISIWNMLPAAPWRVKIGTISTNGVHTFTYSTRYSSTVISDVSIGVCLMSSNLENACIIRNVSAKPI